MRAFKILPVYLALIFFYNDAFSAAQDDFNEGVTYFKQQQYRQAAQAFTRSYKSGLKTPALFHNLGVSYYKLHNYPQAKNYFELAHAYPQQTMLAEYNLGLVAKKQNKIALAHQHFKFVKTSAHDSKLVTLARMQLGEIQISQPQQRWSAYINLAYGHDDNITVVSDTTATKQASNFASIYASADYQLLGDSDSNLTLEGNVSGYDYYVDYRRYDNSRHSLTISGMFRTGSWSNNLALSKIIDTYGYLDYQTITRYTAKAKTNISQNNKLRFRYSHDKITSDNLLYYYLGGVRQRFRTEIRNYGKSHYFKLYHELEINDRTDTATASFSPTRNKVRAFYEQSLSPSIKIGANLVYRTSLYPAKAATAERVDKRQTIGIQFSYKFSKSLKVRAEIEQIDNNSTNTVYAYQRELSSISLIASF